MKIDCRMTSLRHLAPGVALALAVLAGHVTDRTTGQPLPGVHVALSGGGSLSAVTNSDGGYHIRNVKPGHYTVTLSSNDVLPQHYDVTIRPTDKTRTADFVACSTTLDYNCSGGSF